jgi:phosphoglycolate phosphatase-like HAD superfamily hydrolase
MPDWAEKLKSLKPNKEFVVCIDSDGCVFDTMELKQKECFCPQFINHFGLQCISRYGRETWEFVNLYSKTRGCNRFLAVERTLDLLSRRSEVRARNAKVPAMQGLRDWIRRETRLGNPALSAEVKKNPDPDLRLVLEWSLDVNEVVKKIVRDVPPFPLVRKTLEKLTQKADSLVVSQTPCEALEREWEEHGLNDFVLAIAGQEMGTKTEHITHAAGGKYPGHKILMVGDAPGDLKAARGNDALFFPINPGQEEASWERLFGEGLDRFFAGTYAGSYEQELLEEFDKYLPEKPPWK